MISLLTKIAPVSLSLGVKSTDWSGSWVVFIHEESWPVDLTEELSFKPYILLVKTVKDP